MSTSPSKVAKDAKNVKPCLVFELETVAFNGGQAMYEVAKLLLKLVSFNYFPFSSALTCLINAARPPLWQQRWQSMPTILRLCRGDSRAMAAKTGANRPQSVVAKLLGDAAKQGMRWALLPPFRKSWLGLDKSFGVKR